MATPTPRSRAFLSPSEPGGENESARVLRIRAGDEAAFGDVFRAFYGRLCGVVNAHVGSRAIAEELVQELFLRIWRRRERLEITESLEAYLFRGARNTALSHLKRCRVERQWQERVAAGPPRLVPSADEQASERALTRALEQAVAELPERCRLVYTLNRIQGLSYRDIAAALEISEKTVETQMMRALQKLREKLSAYLP